MATVIPQDIQNKIILRNQMTEQINKWFNECESIDSEGLELDTLHHTLSPTGTEQNSGEYCDQVSHGEDWYTGKYYWPAEGGGFICCEYSTW